MFVKKAYDAAMSKPQLLLFITYKNLDIHIETVH